MLHLNGFLPSPSLPPSQVHTFPSTPEVTSLLSSLPERLFFFVANTTSGVIRGFHVVTGLSQVYVDGTTEVSDSAQLNNCLQASLLALADSVSAAAP